MILDSLNRISAYLAAKKEVVGLHPEVIHVIHTKGGKHELRVSDLKAAITAMNMGEYDKPYIITIGDTGKEALVDHVDSGLESYSWSLDSHGYPRRRTPEDWVYMHTDILGKKDGMLPDHINRNPLDNRSSNLRFVTRGQNVVNSPKARNPKATSKYKGVSWAKDRNKWVANICSNDKDINLGRFYSEDAAALAYNDAAVKYFGEAAFLNTVSDSGMVGGLDASTRKDEADSEESRIASPFQPSEISDNAFEDRFMDSIHELGLPDDEFNKWHLDEGELRDFAHGLRQPKPVSGCSECLRKDYCDICSHVGGHTHSCPKYMQE